MSLLLLSLVVAASMAISACSAIGRRETWPAEIANSRWVQSQSYSQVGLKLQYGDVVITMSPFELYHGRNYQVVWLGPPFFPIIPLFRKPVPFKSWSLWSSLKIESPNDTTSIDFSEIELRTSKDKSLPLSSLEEAKGYTKLWHIPANFQEVAIEKKVLSHGTLDFSMRFHPFDSATQEQEFVINFGYVEINGNKIAIPALKCRKTIKYNYIALGIPEHGIP